MLTGPQIVARQASSLAMTPELRRAIGMLKLSNTELAEELRAEAAANPALEVKLAPQDLTLALWGPPAPRRSAPPSLLAGIGGGLAEALGVAGSPGLQEHIEAELRLILRQPGEAAIGVVLAQSVSPWGWLDRDLSEIAAEAGASVAEVETVLRRAQQIDPAGLLARDLRECLWLQAQDQGALTPVMAGVLDHLALLGAGKLDALAGRIGATAEEISATVQKIRGFDPKPGLRFDPAPPPICEPDILVRRKAGGWAVELNRSTLPEITIESTADARQRHAAEVLAKAVTRRNETLLHLAGVIVARQQAWLDHGPARLEPMSYASLAEATGLHETTVGRLAAGRMMATPRGTVTVRALCSPAIATQDGGEISAVALRHRIAEMIRHEGAQALSDARIGETLAKAGLMIARRTVTKYRVQMGLPNATERRTRLGNQNV